MDLLTENISSLKRMHDFKYLETFDFNDGEKSIDFLNNLEIGSIVLLNKPFLNKVLLKKVWIKFESNNYVTWVYLTGNSSNLFPITNAKILKDYKIQIRQDVHSMLAHYNHSLTS